MKASTFISTVERASILSESADMVCTVILKGNYVIDDVDLNGLQDLEEDDTSVDLLSCNCNHYVVELDDILAVRYRSLG